VATKHKERSSPVTEHAPPPANPPNEDSHARPTSSSGGKSHRRHRHHRSDGDRSERSRRDSDHRPRRPVLEERNSSFFGSLFRRS
jgi:hypothetical protein